MSLNFVIKYLQNWSDGDFYTKVIGDGFVKYINKFQKKVFLISIFKVGRYIY